MPRRRIEYSEATGELRLKFSYDAALIDLVRSLPRRRFSPDDKSWYIPGEYAAEVLEKLAVWDFDIPDAVQEMAARGGRNARVRRMRRATRQDSLTPSELNLKVRQALRDAFEKDVWIVGEVSGWRPSNERSFFELVERDPWSGNTPRARVKAVAFSGELDRIQEVMQRMKPPLRMGDGLQVRLLARVEVYERTGSYQLRIREIDPFYTISAMAQQRERVLEALDDLGISECNLKLALPEVPLRVGLITSVGSDAYSDFIQELAQSGHGFQVYVCDARMQGMRLERTVLKALDFFAVHRERVDVVAIVRGGGARTELSQFDTFQIGRSVCNLPVPILCGIGHHLDHSLIDDLTRSFKTPTAVGQALVERVRDFAALLDDLELAILPEATRRVIERRLELEAVSRQVGREASLRLSARQTELGGFAAELGRWGVARLRTERRALEVERLRLPMAARRGISEARRAVDNTTARLSPQQLARRLTSRRRALDDTRSRLVSAVQRRVGRTGELDRMRARLKAAQVRTQRQRRELEEIEGRLSRAIRRHIARQRELAENLESRRAALDPVRVLERGFAWVTDEAGGILRDAERVAQGARLRVRLASGELEATRTDGVSKE